MCLPNAGVYLLPELESAQLAAAKRSSSILAASLVSAFRY